MTKSYYAIDKPYLSNGLRKSYCKKLEVHKMELNESSKLYYAIETYEFKKGKWVVVKTASKSMYASTTIQRSICKDAYLSNGMILFEKFDDAADTKFLLIEKLKFEYERELKYIKDLMERNVPDVTKECNKIRLKHAELFI